MGLMNSISSGVTEALVGRDMGLACVVELYQAGEKWMHLMVSRRYLN